MRVEFQHILFTLTFSCLWVEKVGGDIAKISEMETEWVQVTSD